jgi:hypothetical protein
MDKYLPWTKHYEVGTNKFSVHVQYQGFLPSGQLDQWKHTWMYVLMVGNIVVYQGPWYDLQGKDPGNEEVCDAVASSFGDSEQVTNAQMWPVQLDLVVEKCAAFMHGYFIAEDQENTDYDIISQHMEIEGEWNVVLRPNYLPNRLMEFHHEADAGDVTVYSYTQDRELKFIL